jgi:hypothetical protein
MESNDCRSTEEHGGPSPWWFVILDLASLAIAAASLLYQLQH